MVVHKREKKKPSTRTLIRSKSSARICHREDSYRNKKSQEKENANCGDHQEGKPRPVPQAATRALRYLCLKLRYYTFKIGYRYRMILWFLSGRKIQIQAIEKRRVWVPRSREKMPEPHIQLFGGSPCLRGLTRIPHYNEGHARRAPTTCGLRPVLVVLAFRFFVRKSVPATIPP
jgi:hypothetical protein